MSQSYTYSESTTFTITHAKHIAAKVVTDLKRMQRFYDHPSDADIADYLLEIIALLKAGYLDTIQYGFKRNGNFIEPALIYTAQELTSVTANDDDPGGIMPGADIRNATFYSYLKYNPAWKDLSPNEKEAFRKILPFKRSNADEPGINGYLSNDRVYSSGGRALERASVRSY